MVTMGADERLVAADPPLGADRHFGEAGSSSPRGPRRRGVALVASALAVLGTLAGVGAYRALASRGTVRIKTKPAGAEVNFDGITTTTDYPEGVKWDVDGAEVTWSRPLTLRRQPGTYDVSVTVPGYVSRATRVVVEPGRAASLDIELQPITDMRLEVASRPTGRPVYIDGHRVKDDADFNKVLETDLTVYAIAAGRHDIKIDGDCHYLDWVQTVELRPGAITRVEATLAPRPFRPTGCTEDEWRKKE
jgi:hypothetical protein